MTTKRGTRKKTFRDESTIRSLITNTIDMTIFRGISFRYFWFNDVVEEYIGVNSVNPSMQSSYIYNHSRKDHYMRWSGRKEKDGTSLFMGHLFTRDRDEYKDGPAFTLILINKHIFMNPRLIIYLLLNITTKKDFIAFSVQR